MATYTMQELELETAELLPARETLWCCRYGSSSSGLHQNASTSTAGTATTRATATATPESSARVFLNGNLNGNLDGNGRPVLVPRSISPRWSAVRVTAGTRQRPGGPPGRTRAALFPWSHLLRQPGRRLSAHPRGVQIHECCHATREHPFRRARPTCRQDARLRRLTATAGRWCGVARRVQELRLQQAAVAGPACRRPGHPDVPAAVPGGLPDRRLPWSGRHRGVGQRRPRPVTGRRTGQLPHQCETASPWHRRHGGPRRRPAEGQPVVRAESAVYVAARAHRQPRWSVPPSAVPVARRCGRGQQHAGRGLLAVLRPRARCRDRAGPARPSGFARRARPYPCSPPCSTSAGTRLAAATAAHGQP